jgi:carbamoyl-phosphate synthase large subunit
LYTIGEVADVVRDHPPRKVLVLGSGALRIGQAGEFDYSGTQALKALREEGIQTVLINPNIATIQTSEGVADRVYFLPVTPTFVARVIAREQPDAVLLSFGGQTALNCGVDLFRNGTLGEHGVQVLGTPVKSIEDTEDRELFVQRLAEIDVPVPTSIPVTTVKDALEAALSISYPVMARAAFALGGRGSGVAHDEGELREIATRALAASGQLLVEEYLGGWKEVEYEVVRDGADNCITVCNMENLDPLGIHTGESIVVAPSQTLSDEEYHLLREASIRIVRHLGIVGECNVQYALDPKSTEYRVIEVNARLSRSSALASKATGYPLAYVATKLALGYKLPEIPNAVTQRTSACFEPALDYVVTKVPRWDLQKFPQISKKIGSEMKSVGEVMAIGRTFEESLQKAMRMLQVGIHGLVANDGQAAENDAKAECVTPTDQRILHVAQALEEGATVAELYEGTAIDPWFLERVKTVVDFAKAVKEGPAMDASTMRRAKQLGFSDHQIGKLIGRTEADVRLIRIGQGVTPVVRQIDTLAGEFPARTNYLYLTYDGTTHDVVFPRRRAVIVLGSGAYRIGSSVEFDWCGVKAVQTARACGYETIMVNYNPETVSTDFDICDRLYFEELSFERVQDIHELENPEGVVISFGGQIPNNLASRCHSAGMRIMGTHPDDVDRAEDRHRFSALLDRLEVDQPPWTEASSVKGAFKFAKKVGYPVLVRPSYVLSGAAMSVAFNEDDLDYCLSRAAKVAEDHPVVVSKYFENSKEVEIDAVARDGRLLAWAVVEHVENAGVHSGDATMVLPPQRTYLETVRRVKNIAREVARALRVSGPMNLQFLARDNRVMVIECNLRASRSVPFVSKTLKVDFVDLATRVMLGEEVPAVHPSALELDYVAVKAPQFSYSRLHGTDPVPSVEMASTGEVGCFGEDLDAALIKSLLATDFVLPRKGALVTVSGDENRFKLLDVVRDLAATGLPMYATEHTQAFFSEEGVNLKRVHKIHEKAEPNVCTLMAEGAFDLVVAIPEGYAQTSDDASAAVRREAARFSVPLLANIQLARAFMSAVTGIEEDDLHVRAWDEYK